MVLDNTAVLVSENESKTQCHPQDDCTDGTHNGKETIELTVGQGEEVNVMIMTKTDLLIFRRVI